MLRKPSAFMCLTDQLPTVFTCWHQVASCDDVTAPHLWSDCSANVGENKDGGISYADNVAPALAWPHRFLIAEGKLRRLMDATQVEIMEPSCAMCLLGIKPKSVLFVRWRSHVIYSPLLSHTHCDRSSSLKKGKCVGYVISWKSETSGSATHQHLPGRGGSWELRAHLALRAAMHAAQGRPPGPRRPQGTIPQTGFMGRFSASPLLFPCSFIEQQRSS